MFDTEGFEDFNGISEEDFAAYRIEEDDRASLELLSAVRIGITGEISETQIPEAKRVLSRALGRLYGSSIEIVAKLVDRGVSRAAYEVAQELEFRTAGVAPRVALDETCSLVDRREIVGEDWGQETETFINQVSIIICLGRPDLFAECEKGCWFVDSRCEDFGLLEGVLSGLRSEVASLSRSLRRTSFERTS
jgi:hypothetical protein